jgi:hypothetical protein
VSDKPQVRSAPKVEIDDAKLALDVIAGGNLENLSDAQKGKLYLAMCEATGLNPAFRPFGIIETKQGHKFYAFKSASDQLRKLNNLNVVSIDREIINGELLVVTVTMQDQAGRMDQDIGAVSIKGKGGEFLEIAYMKAYTKAKRRCTLAIAGLGILDECEIETIPGSRIIDVTNLQQLAEGDVSHETPPDNRNDERTKQMAKLHAVAKEQGYDHEAVRKLACHVYPIESTTELVLAQVKTLAQALDPNSGPVPEAIDAVYAAHALGIDNAKDRLKTGLFGTSQKKMINEAIKLVESFKSGEPAVNDPSPAPALEPDEPQGPPEPPEPAPPKGRHTVEVINDTTGEIITVEQEVIGTIERQPTLGDEIDDLPIDSAPQNWTEFWGFLKQNGIKNMNALNDLIGQPAEGATPADLYKLVAKTLVNA